jgi:hypothetical protein
MGKICLNVDRFQYQRGAARCSIRSANGWSPLRKVFLGSTLAPTGTTFYPSTTKLQLEVMRDAGRTLGYLDNSGTGPGDEVAGCAEAVKKCEGRDVL